MKFDVIVIGAGFGGLSCAARCAKVGKKVLVLEKKNHSGGTSSVFYRHGYGFPMGALGFSRPEMVLDMLERMGAEEKPSFSRNHFQLRSPGIDIVYSIPFQNLINELARLFPHEKGLAAFFEEFEPVLDLIRGLHLWHPFYKVSGDSEERSKPGGGIREKMEAVDKFAAVPGEFFVDRHLTDPVLKSFLGSMGTRPPHMSMLNMAVMWHLMCEAGIWTPSCGIHGLADLIKDALLGSGGELLLNSPVKGILVREGRASGVETARGEIYESDWVVSGADAKTTLLSLVDEEHLPTLFRENLRAVPYSGSEMCLYLGVDPVKIDWSAMRARHLFYQKRRRERDTIDPAEFNSREIEICLWSENNPSLVPSGKASLVLRAGFSYDLFARFRTGEKGRTSDYRAFKESLSQSLLHTAENILPGLHAAVEVRESATPLTYRDWGQRYRGSIAGWSWGIHNRVDATNSLLVRTPLSNLFLAGIYASSELYFGGVPTAMYTGLLAAEMINRQS